MRFLQLKLSSNEVKTETIIINYKSGYIEDRKSERYSFEYQIKNCYWQDLN